MGELGPGFPLLFEFIKYSAFVLGLLTIIYFVPAMAMITIALKKINVQPNQGSLALFSFGAFITDSSKAM